MTDIEQRKRALQLLGIRDEEHLLSVRQTIADTAISADQLLELLPLEIIALAGPFQKPDCIESVSRQLSVDAPSVKAAKDIFDSEIGPAADHPSFPALKSLVKKFIEKKSLKVESSDEAPSEHSPYLSIVRVAHAPLLLGKKPPFLPLIRVKFLDSQDQGVWDEQMTWFDAIFLANSLIRAVNEHAEGIQGMITQGLIVSAEPGSLDEAFGELERGIESLRSLLARNPAATPSQA